MKQKALIYVLMVLLFACMCIMENSAVSARAPETENKKVSSIYMLAGEFRTVFANLLWLKVDNYHHEYIASNKDWHNNTELLGLLDMIVMLDPQFEEAYAVGACIYADGCDDKEKAINFLRQGISSNPKSRELYELLAVLYARHMNDPERALVYAKLAAKYAEDDWYKTRTTRLQRTIERDIREKKAASLMQPEKTVD